MKNLRLLSASLLLVLLASISVSAQVVNTVAGSIRGGPTLPTTCTPATSARRADVFIKTGSGAGVYYCSSSNTFTQLAAGGGGGSGDVVGPASATNNAAVRFDLTTGKLIKNSTVLIGDTGNVTGLGTLNTHTLPGGTDTIALLAATQTFTNKTYNGGTLSGTFGGTPTFGAITVSSCTGCGGGSPGGSTGDYQINNAGSLGAGVLAQSAGRLTATPTAASSGVASYLRFITPADTGLTASTEAPGIVFGGDSSGASVTRGRAAGALTTQREYIFIAPTYTAASATTCTTCATVAITGAPTAGTNWTSTKSLALWVTGRTEISDGGAVISVNSGAATLSLGGNSIVVDSGNPRLVTGSGTLSYSGLVLSPGASNLTDLGTTSFPFKNGYFASAVRVGGAGSASAQLHVLSQAVGTVPGRFDCAASPTADCFQVTINGSTTAGNYYAVTKDGAVQMRGVAFASLPTVANGLMIYCTDCTIASPCASGGSGAMAKGINGAWACN